MLKECVHGLVNDHYHTDTFHWKRIINVWCGVVWWGVSHHAHFGIPYCYICCMFILHICLYRQNFHYYHQIIIVVRFVFVFSLILRHSLAVIVFQFVHKKLITIARKHNRKKVYSIVFCAHIYKCIYVLNTVMDKHCQSPELLFSCCVCGFAWVCVVCVCAEKQNNIKYRNNKICLFVNIHSGS